MLKQARRARSRARVLAPGEPGRSAGRELRDPDGAGLRRRPSGPCGLLRSFGQALLFTSCVLAFGFLVYTQAYMVHLFNFRILTSGAIAMAFLADLTLAPALLTKAMRERPPPHTGARDRP